jgi:hypothetical protein
MDPVFFNRTLELGYGCVFSQFEALPRTRFFGLPKVTRFGKEVS